MAKTSEDTEEGPRSFGVFLTHLGDGEALIALSKEQHDLLIALAEEADRTQSTVKGSLTLKIDFKVEHSGVVGAVYSIATKEPSPPRGGSIFWLSKGKNLTVENPRQKKLPFDVVEVRGEVREVPEREKGAPRGV